MATALAAQKPPLGQKMPSAGLRLKNSSLSRRMHREKCRPPVRLASGAPVFANGAVTAAMSYALSSLGNRERRSTENDPSTISDAEILAQLEASGFYDLDTALAECGGCMAQDRMHRAYLAGNATQADLMGLYRAQAEGALLGLSIISGGYGVRALWMTQLRSDLFRTGPTVVSNQLVRGQGVPGASVTWGIKGGGPGMPFHYHIHRHNWYRPWTWFRQTPIIKP